MFDQQNRGKGSGFPHGALLNLPSCPECVDTNPRHHHHEIHHSHDYSSVEHTHDYEIEGEDDE